MYNSNKLKAGTALLLPLAMAACSDRSDTTTATPSPGSPPPAASIQSRIGASFAAFFDASNSSDPREPTAADAPALNPAADPLDN